MSRSNRLFVVEVVGFTAVVALGCRPDLPSLDDFGSGDTATAETGGSGSTSGPGTSAGGTLSGGSSSGNDTNDGSSGSSGTAGSDSGTAGVDAAGPIAGYSPLSLDFVEIVDFSDDFEGPTLAPSWILFPPLPYPGSGIDLVDGAVRIDTGAMEAGRPSTPYGVATKFAFEAQSFEVDALLQFEPETEGERCAAIAFDPDTDAGIGFAVGLCRVRLGGPMPLTLVILASGGGSLAMAPFEAVTNGVPYTLHLEYDLESLTLSGSVDGVSPEPLVGVVFEGGPLLLLSETGFGDQTVPLTEDSRSAVSFASLTSTLQAHAYETSLAPFQRDDGTPHDAGLLVTPGTLFIDDIETPTEIRVDHTPIAADGVTDYHVALIETVPGRTPAGDLHTAITSLDLAQLQATEEIAMVHDFLPSVYLAQGPGLDYAICPLERSPRGCTRSRPR